MPGIWGTSFGESAKQFSPHSDLPDSQNLALQFIDNRFCDPELTRTAVAEAAGISVVLLGNLFREYLHTTVNHYITALRLDRTVLSSGFLFLQTPLYCRGIYLVRRDMTPYLEFLQV